MIKFVQDAAKSKGEELKGKAEQKASDLADLADHAKRTLQSKTEETLGKENSDKLSEGLYAAGVMASAAARSEIQKKSDLILMYNSNLSQKAVELSNSDKGKEVTRNIQSLAQKWGITKYPDTHEGMKALLKTKEVRKFMELSENFLLKIAVQRAFQSDEFLIEYFSG